MYFGSFSNNSNRNTKPCKYGPNCSYLRQGNCWFYHPAEHRQRNTSFKSRKHYLQLQQPIIQVIKLAFSRNALESTWYAATVYNVVQDASLKRKNSESLRGEEIAIKAESYLKIKIKKKEIGGDRKGKIEVKTEEIWRNAKIKSNAVITWEGKNDLETGRIKSPALNDDES